MSLSLLTLLWMGHLEAQPAMEARLSPVPFFAQPVVAVGASSVGLEEAAMLEWAISRMPGQDTLEMAELFEAFVAERPESVWTPSLRMNLGRYYFDESYYTRALEHWAEAWEATAHHPSGVGKRIADYALSHWTRLLVGLGRLELLGLIFEENRGRILDRGPLQQKYIRTEEYYWYLRYRPEAAYRCGWMVLDELAFWT